MTRVTTTFKIGGDTSHTKLCLCCEHTQTITTDNKLIIYKYLAVEGENVNAWNSMAGSELRWQLLSSQRLLIPNISNCF